MTITTAKLPGKALRLTPLALAALLVAAESHADTTFTPTIGLAGTYSDNPTLLPSNQAQGQFIIESVPAFTLRTRSRRLRLDVGADWHFYGYQDRDISNVRHRDRRYGGSGEAILIDDLLSVAASANGSSQAVSAFGPQFGNQYSNTNRTDVRTWSVSPTLKHRFGSTADLTLVATRDGVESDQVNAAYGDSQSTTAILNLSSGVRFTTLSWGLSYTRQALDSRQLGSTTSQNANLSLRYRLSRTWSALATAGYDDYEYLALRDRTAGRSYTAGFSWTPTSRTSIEATFGHRYFGKTGSLAATSRARHLVSRITYSDLVTTNRQQFLLPSAVSTSALLDQLFSSSIPDPALRAEAVQAYIKATGLPPSLANDVNYLSNRYQREKRLEAAYIVTMPHSSLVMSAYKSERIALSSQQSDSQLLGSQFLALNDDVRQRGLNATFSYRLSPRTSANASAWTNRATSIATGIESPSKTLTLGLSRQFDRKTRGSLELRHNSSRFDVRGGEVTENALMANLSVQL